MNIKGNKRNVGDLTVKYIDNDDMVYNFGLCHFKLEHNVLTVSSFDDQWSRFVIPFGVIKTLYID